MEEVIPEEVKGMVTEVVDVIETLPFSLWEISLFILAVLVLLLVLSRHAQPGITRTSRRKGGTGMDPFRGPVENERLYMVDPKLANFDVPVAREMDLSSLKAPFPKIPVLPVFDWEQARTLFMGEFPCKEEEDGKV